VWLGSVALGECGRRSVLHPSARTCYPGRQTVPDVLKHTFNLHSRQIMIYLRFLIPVRRCKALYSSSVVYIGFTCVRGVADLHGGLIVALVLLYMV
jgi:hypothetical protein